MFPKRFDQTLQLEYYTMGKWVPSEDGSEQLPARLFPDTLGRVFGAMAVVGGSSFLLSFFSVFGYVILFTPPDGAPLPLPIVVAGIGSWACVVVSLWGYVIWASRKIRNQSRDSGRPTRLNADERDLYEQRKRWRFLALGFGVLALLAPVAIAFGSPRG